MTSKIGAFSSAAEMLVALKSGAISAVELLDLHIRRIEHCNARVNAIVIPNFDGARAAAEAADAERARGSAARLLGLPITIKDCIDSAGLPGPAGEADYADRRPERDALAVHRLRSAGAVILGKTNVPPFASDWQTSNELFGRTVNPWDTSKTPGGSTGGGAAAIAVGMTPLEMGSDISGSIRIPAAFCGVYGHKPSETALPRTGHFPGDALPNPGALMMVMGPLARNAADLRLALRVAAGAEVGEDRAWRLAMPRSRRTELNQFRVAIMPRPPWLPLDSEIAGSIDKLASDLRRSGAFVDIAQPDLFEDFRQHHKLFSALLGVMTAANQTPEGREERSNQKACEEFEESYCRAFAASASDYFNWVRERELFRESYRAFFRQWDVLVAPCNITPAFAHNDEPQQSRTLKVDGRDVEYYLQLVYAGAASLSGQPATAFPFGFTRSGLPIGLQAIGPYLEDETAIGFAELVGKEFGGFVPPPGFD